MKLNLKLKYLPPEEWEQFREIIEDHFDNAMPSPFDAALFGIYDGAKLIGFTHLEKIIHLNAIWIDENHRHDLKFSDIIPEVERLVPKGMSVFILPDKRIEKFMSRCGARKLESSAVWRVDL